MRTNTESEAAKSSHKDVGNGINSVRDGGTGEERRPAVQVSSASSFAPDGGYGWVIVFASFMCQFIVDGTAFSFGVFSPEFEVYFSSSSGKTSLVGSVLSGSYLLTAPLASVLTNRYGYRPVTIAGSLIGTFGFGISSLSSSIDVLLVTFGIIGGFGLGLIYLPAIVAVSEYFDKRRPFATGIVVCGSGVGCFLFAPFFNFLLHAMGWKYAVVILAGITLNGCVFGALLRSLPAAREVRKALDTKSPRQKNALDRVGEVLKIRRASGTSGDDDAVSFVAKHRRLEELRTEKEEKLRREDEETELVAMMNSELDANGDSRPLKNAESVALTSSNAGSRRRVGDAASRRSSASMISASMLQIALPVQDATTGKRSRALLDGDNADRLDDNRSTTTTTTTTTKSGPASKSSVFLRVTGLYLLRDPLFCVPCVANLFAMVGLFIPFFFITQRAGQLPDADGTKAAFLLSVIAIFNTGGRLLVGFVAGFKKVSSLLIHNVALVTGGVACVLSMFCVNYWLTCIYAAYFGLCVAAWISLTSIILCDLLGIERLSNSFGILTLVRGISTLIGPPIAGNIYDSTNDYNNSFHVGGVMLLTGGLICCLLHLPSLQRRKFSRQSKNEEGAKQNGRKERV